jgi:hypothetical protein
MKFSCQEIIGRGDGHKGLGAQDNACTTKSTRIQDDCTGWFVLRLSWFSSSTSFFSRRLNKNKTRKKSAKRLRSPFGLRTNVVKLQISSKMSRSLFDDYFLN